MSMQPSKFCFIFSLRQGTICIAVTELTVVSFSLLLLILGAERAQEIAMEAAADMVDTTEFSEYVPVEDQGLLGVPVFFLAKDDGHFLHRGQQLATVVMFLLYTGVVLATTHLLTCILLLYGAVKGIPRFLLPWTSIVLLGMVLLAFSLLLFGFLPYPGCKAEVYALSTLLLALEFHSWVVVFSHYRELTSSANCRLASNILANYDLINPVQYPRVDI